MGDLVVEGSIGLLKLGASGFGIVEGDLKVIVFYSYSVQLSIEIGNSGVKMGDLVCQGGIG